MDSIAEKRRNAKERFSQKVIEFALTMYAKKAECDAGPVCTLSIPDISDHLFDINKPFPNEIHPWFFDLQIMRPICDTLASQIGGDVQMTGACIIMQYPAV